MIQQNPIIMQESDKTVRVECSFDANDQTVSYAPNGGLGPKDHEGGGISVTYVFFWFLFYCSNVERKELIFLIE